MKVTQGKVEEREVTLRIELDDDDLEPYLNRGFRQVVGKMRIPGFRPGKAPRRVVEGMIGREGLITEVLDFLAADVVMRAVEEHEIDIAGVPRVNDVEFDPIVIEATVALNPVLDLGDYRNIRVEEDLVEVSDTDVDKELHSLREFQSSWEPVDRPVLVDDMITMNVVATVDGVEILNEEDSEYRVDPATGNPFPGFAAELEGMGVDETADFTLEVPDDYPDHELVGKSARFLVEITGVKQRVLPELDDEFARSVGDEFETFDQLVAHLRKNLEEQVSRQNEHEYRELVIEELVLNADMEVAPTLVKYEVERMENRRDEMMRRLEISPEDYNRFTGKTDEQIRDEMHEEAVEKLNRSYAVSAFIAQESLDITDDELNSRLKQIAREKDESTGRKLTNKELRSEQVRTSIRESLLVEKAIDLLVRIARGQEGESSREEVQEEVAVQSTI